MRITNNIILHNTTGNINGNKVNVNNLNNQMTSQKKIQRPSENPAIAVRSLRLRTTLSEIDQYYENNIPDAESWMKVTETALANMKRILTDIRTQCTYGASDQITADDRKTILTQLEKLRDQVYAEGNADYAGRTVFTGYRTNQKLTFMTDGNALSANGATGTLSYSYTDAAGVTQTDGELKVTVYDTFEDWAKASQTADNTYNITDGEAVFIKESGELILSSDASSTIKSGRASLDVNYTKTGFNKGEVRPEYYYNCTNITDAAKPVEYIKFENGKEIYQDINYVVAANQTLTVNTQASAVFDASIGRDVDAMIEAVKFAQDANNKVEELEKMQKMQEYSSDDCQAALEDWIAAAKKERDYADDNLQKLYNSYIGNFDDYLQKVNLANTDLGSKGQSLDLTKNRMANQQTTMEELKSTNEDRDLSEIIIDYTSAYTAYQASLQAAAKINQTTLLNYI